MKANDRLIPIEVLRARYSYCPDTGHIRFKTGHKGMIGKIAGTLNSDGYRIIRIPYKGRRIEVKAHRLGYAIHHGRHADHELDHENRDRDANWLANLRPATRAQNNANRKVDLGALPRGVCVCRRSKRKPYQAQISANGRKIFLGLFETIEAAAEAYREAARHHHGDFMRLA